MPQTNLKPIRYALHSRIQTILLISFICVGVSACSAFGGRVDKIETSSVPESVTPLKIPTPSPLTLSRVDWIVVTPANVAEVMKDLSDSGRQQVLIALTPNDYERLSLDFAEIRKYINNQRAILIRYQDYYESGDGDASP